MPSALFASGRYCAESGQENPVMACGQRTSPAADFPLVENLSIGKIENSL
jgi:hypothetical protein